MKKKLKLISAMIIVSMIFPIFSAIIQPVFAADAPIKVYVDSYNKTTATVSIHWDAVPNVTSGTIQYHVPNGAGFQTVQVPIDPTKNSASISQIQSDVIYDFKVMLTNNSAQTFAGQLFFLAQVSVYAEQVDQQPISLTGGGVETGVYPSIKLSWNMPKVFNNSNNAMEYANEALAQIDGSIRKLNFTFNITSDQSLANILVKMGDDGQYTAAVSGDTDAARFSKVKWDNTTGKLSFYILGVKDSETIIPTMEAIRLNSIDLDTGLATLPRQISNAADNEFVLPHQEILPGTIYKITMNTFFMDSLDQYVGTVAEGLTENPLIGTTNYTYTPIRFQLTKDTYDNIYVRIYRIDQGGVTMPRLYYEVQTSNVPSDQDTTWTVRKKLDDSYFNGPFAITVLTGISSKNTVYYRIVVKSDGVSDRVQSLKLPYLMQNDVAKPPVPKEISISKIDLAVPPAGSGITDRSSNVTITWDKPSNWDQIKGNLANDVYFHFLLNINPKDLSITPTPSLEANGKNYGIYPVKYRLVKYVSANSPNIKESGNKLVYTLNGYDLFKGEDDQGATLIIPNTDNYPTYLLPNKTYYLQMYTTLASDRGAAYDSAEMSEKSLIKSFTSLSAEGRDVPIPQHLELVETKINQKTASSAANASIKIRFDDLAIDWANYTTKPDDDDAVLYDLYMSTRTEPNSFIKIGTTETAGDVSFTKQTLGNTTWVYATINKFAEVKNVTAFGTALAPNTTYYFMIKVRLKMINETQQKESIETALLPVTTPRAGSTVPDDTEKKPLAPIDFKIALDSKGNSMVTGQTVTFEWTVQENAAAYNLIATGQRVAANTPAGDPSILQDAVFMSFISAFGNKDNNADNNGNKLTLDPNFGQFPSGFSYNSATKKCRYTINTWLYPNKIYYFSLRSEIVTASGEKDSVWVSIPVTTSLIESPSLLQVVNDCELGFYWFDTLAGMTSDNYRILLKAPTDSDYKTLAKSQYSIVKYDSVYYGRLLKLKANTNYSIKVVRSTDNALMSIIERSTRNDYYQIDVKWQGYAIDPYSGFEIAVKTEDDSDYTVLNNDVDLEKYVDITTHTYPYYIEKSNSNVNSNYYTYQARIKMAPTKLPDGTIEHRPLKPNTKYYIKVRAVKVDASDLSAVTPSKYVGPVNTRTEFSQDDYDDEDQNTNNSAKFLDMIDELQQDLYWSVNQNNGVVNKILVKDDRIVNLLEGYGVFTCTVDISQSAAYINTEEVYIAKNILQAMDKNNKSLILKTKNAEYTLRPGTFDVDNMTEFTSAKSITGSKDVYLKLRSTQSAGIQPKMPENTAAASKMSVLTAQAVASKLTSTDVNNLIKDKLYNEQTGLIQKKLAIIKNPNNANTHGDAAIVNKYLKQLLNDVKNELSYYLEDTLSYNASGTLMANFDIAKFSSPMVVKMSFQSNSPTAPYVTYGSTGDWNKLTQNVKFDSNTISYFVSGTGSYAILSTKDISSTVADDNDAKPYIAKLSANYDLASVFPGAETSFNASLTVTVKESILLYELIAESSVDSQTDVKTKAKNYGIDKIINITNLNRNISRQEAAALVIKLYCQRTGADYDRLTPSYSKTIKDDDSIGEKLAIPVYMALQLNIMTLDPDSCFNPTKAINRAEIAVVFQKMLEA